jgi:Tfp pilus assembly protein PilO
MNSKRRKTIIRVVIGIVVILDLVLLAANWKLTSSPDTSVNQLRLLRGEREMMAADVRRAQDIRASLPQVQSETQDFFQKDLRPIGTAYSSMSEDLDALAKDAGLRISSTRFHEQPVEKRGVDEVNIAITLLGPYSNVVNFINGLERSNSFYLLDSLQLDSSAEGVLKLDLELRTYLRS